MIVFIGMETSGALRRAFQTLGHETYSCDLLPSMDGGEEMVMGEDHLPKGRHLIGDVFDTLDHLYADDLWPDLAIFHPSCTYLRNSAEWAYKDPDFDRYPGVGYHQRLKPGTLFGAARRQAREEAKDQFRRIAHLPIRRKVIENPRGALSSIRKPSQVVQPYQFGDDASKATCLWFFGKDGEDLSSEMKVPVDPAMRRPGRMVFDKNLGRIVERWSNQTDQGQNRLSPDADRWQARSKTYDGIAKALAAHLHSILQEPRP